MGTIIFLLTFYRPVVKRIINRFIRLILTETYSKNIWEIFSSGRRYNPFNIVQNALRSEQKEAIVRSMGTPHKLVKFDGLMFLPAQLAILPTKEEYKIKTDTVIGPRANRPLKLPIPLMVAGMGVGTALSESMKLAIAKGTAKIKTATNTGEGPFLEEERKLADKLVVQYGRNSWAKEPEVFQQADMVEIVAGTGAMAGTPYTVPAKRLSEKLRRKMGLSSDEDGRILARVPQVDRPEDWQRLVDHLREITDGVPIGIKIIPAHIEKDLEWALKAEVDFITVDGAQAGTKESAPILQDDMGLPTIRGLVRAVNFLEEKGARDRVSVIVSGGLFTPGEYLKAIALGADAVALGTVILHAAMHTQVTKVLPWEPPPQLAWYEGKASHQLDIEKAARNIANLLNASVEEMKIAVTCIGKKGIMELDREDLVALDPETARLTGVTLAYEREVPSKIKKIIR